MVILCLIFEELPDCARHFFCSARLFYTNDSASEQTPDVEILFIDHSGCRPVVSLLRSVSFPAPGFFPWLLCWNSLFPSVFSLLFDFSFFGVQEGSLESWGRCSEVLRAASTLARRHRQAEFVSAVRTLPVTSLGGEQGCVHCLLA